ncbi:MAG: peptidyl-prolyl cis-trans isomerase [Gammaproteobacteria bacterium]|nr:peptidyl-prolyl cis-trans isomerase [Gammaproteobacteria bacterium]
MNWKTPLAVFMLCALAVPPLGAAPSKNIKPVQIALTTSMGKIVLELDEKKAPKTVANFLGYVKKGHYNGLIFHRVISSFMIQGGGFDKNMEEKPAAAPIENEADNGLANLRGTIAMARTNDPHSATAQFFINVADNPMLDFKSKTVQGWGYAVFGKVVAGMDVVDKIREVPTGSKGIFQDVPQTPVIIEKVEIVNQAAK